MALHIFTQEEFDMIPRDEHGWKHCPSGDYTQIKNFPNHCIFEKSSIFGSGAVFGNWCRLGDNCLLGDGCYLRAGCQLGNYCSYGENVSFEDGNVYGKNVRMLQISRIGSRNGCTFFWKHDGGIYVRCGCFAGDIDAFAEKVEKTHAENPQHLKEYRGAMRYAKEVFGVEETA